MRIGWLNSIDSLRGNCPLKGILSVFVFLMLFPLASNGLALDSKMELIIDAYELSAKNCVPEGASSNIDAVLLSMGEVFFTTPILSGDKDTSCSTCHLDDKFLTDGLALSVGVGGEGEGEERVRSNGIIVPRNSFSLFGRTHPEFTSYFWDGKIQEKNGLLYSPIGEGYSMGFNSALAIAAVLPVLARDEFLGTMTAYGGSAHLESVNQSYYQDKVPAINKILAGLLQDSSDPDVRKLAEGLDQIEADVIDLALVGNSLARFIRELTSTCSSTKWNEYLKGDRSALTSEQKRGAVSFYGKGRCAACHTGDFFSDFKFHSIGVPQGEFGTHIHKQDIGRASVTFDLADRFKFRTPPLLYVSKTSPYGHNGSFDTLQEVVMFHVNPIPYFVSKGWTSREEAFSYGSILATRSSTLGYIELDESEMKEVLSFLNAL